MHQDPQLAHREFFVKLDHPRIGETLYDGPVTHFSATPARVRNAGPTIGQDTFQVMSELLGYGEEEIASLAAEGVLT